MSTSSSAASGAERSNRRRSINVGVLSLAHVVNDSYGYVLQAILPAIITRLDLTLGLAGVLVSVFQLTSSLVQPLVGHLADRSSLRWPAWAGVAMSGVAAGLLGLAPSYLALVGLLVVSGLGTAIFHPVSGAMVGAEAPPRVRGRWMGLYVTAGNFGLAIGPFMIGSLLERSGPNGTWPIMIPSIALAALVAFMAPRRTGPRRGAASLREILRRHRHLLSALILVVTFRAWANTSLVTFIPLLAEARGLSVGDSAHVLTVFLLAAAIGGLIGGFAADHWGRDRVIIASLLVSVPFGLTIALHNQADPLFLLAVAGSGLFLNGSFIVLIVRGQESIPGSIGMVTGIMLGLSIGLGGLAVTPMAILAERFGVITAVGIAGIIGLPAAAAMRLLPPAPVRPTASGI